MESRRMSAPAQARGLYKAHFAKLMVAMLLSLCLRLICLAPALLLATKEVPFLALICVALWILIVLPARQNWALAMADLMQTGDFSLFTLVSPSGYGKKLGKALKTTGFLLLWGLPAIAAAGYAVFVWKGDPAVTHMDVFTLVRTLIRLGGGSCMNGIKIVVLIFLGLLLIFVAGLAFHSPCRYASALTGSARLKKGRLACIGVWLEGLLTLVPFLAAAVLISRDYVTKLISAISGFAQTMSLELPALDARIWLIALAFVLLCLPLLPLKSLMTACKVRQLTEGRQ